MIIESIFNSLPKKLKSKIRNNEKINKALGNIGWLLSDNIIRLGGGLLVGVWVARYLGPEQFGLLNYAIAVVALFSSVATLGLNGIVVRDIISHKKTVLTTLGTSFALQLVGGILALVCAFLMISLLRPGDGVAKFIVAILGLGVIFKASEIIQYWFEAEVNSKYIVLARRSAFIVSSIMKIILILVNAPLFAFALATLLESILTALGFFWVYKMYSTHALTSWKFSFHRSKELLKQSWPLILSGLALMMYMRVDQVMLGKLEGDASVGIYSAAIRVSEIWYFIPIAIISSFFPMIIQSREKSEEEYLHKLQNLYDVLVILALILAGSITIFSNIIITTLFGEQYLEASVILTIHAWTGVFYFLSSASGRWYIGENLQIMAFGRNIFGVFISILLNMILIPTYGAVGAAISTLIAYSCSAYFFDIFSDKTRMVFVQKTKSLFLVNAIIFVRKKSKQFKS